MSEHPIGEAHGLPLLSPVRVLLDGKIHQEGLPRLGQVLESMARSAVANCAARLLVPPLSPPAHWMLNLGGNASLRCLALSTRRRIRFVDRGDSTWFAIRSYFLPIQRAIQTKIEPGYDAGRLALFFYYLALSTRWSAQFYYPDTPRVRQEIDRLLREEKHLPAEVAMRLSVLRGCLGFLEHKQTLPALSVRTGRELHFRDYLEEILEDAYLAEASVLRRFLSYEANKASVRRGLRRLLHAITTERKWSHGVVAVGEQLAIMPKSVLDTAGKLLEQLGPRSSSGGPVVLTSHSALAAGPGRRGMWNEFARELEPSEDGSRIVSYVVFDDDNEPGEP